MLWRRSESDRNGNILAMVYEDKPTLTVLLKERTIYVLPPSHFLASRPVIVTLPGTVVWRYLAKCECFIHEFLASIIKTALYIHIYHEYGYDTLSTI